MIVNEYEVSSEDKSNAQRLLMDRPEEFKSERAGFFDEILMIKHATIVAPDDAIGRRHIENFRTLCRAYYMEFRKPYPNIYFARRVSKQMDEENAAIERRATSP